ncbi:MAG: methyltransferase [Myxococcaceae bacterium]
MDVEALLHRVYVGVEGTSLRDEDRKKALEVRGFLEELKRVSPSQPLLDAAAGKAYVGLFAASLLGFQRVTALERDERRVADAKRAAEVLGVTLDARVGEVGDASAWPAECGVVVALHACGPASDDVIDAVVARQAPWLFLVPCCYSKTLRTWAAAQAKADALGVPSDAPLRAKFVQSMVDTERVLRLEAGGYETEVVSFVAPTVTPHHLLFRARRTANPQRQARARARLEAWTSP